MKEEVIIEAARKYEKSTGFGDIVLRAKGINSAAGIGFLEGAVWMQEQMMKDAVNGVAWEDFNDDENKYLVINATGTKLSKGDRFKLIIIKEDEK